MRTPIVFVQKCCRCYLGKLKIFCDVHPFDNGDLKLPKKNTSPSSDFTATAESKIQITYIPKNTQMDVAEMYYAGLWPEED